MWVLQFAEGLQMNNVQLIIQRKSLYQMDIFLWGGFANMWLFYIKLLAKPQKELYYSLKIYFSHKSNNSKTFLSLPSKPLLYNLVFKSPSAEPVGLGSNLGPRRIICMTLGKLFNSSEP